MLRAVLMAFAIAAMPMCVKADSQKITKADVQKVLAIINDDKAKSQTYCEILELSEQIQQAYEKKDDKIGDELSEKMEKLEETLGPEYVALMDGLQDIDPENDDLSAEIMSAFGTLDSLCAG